jgi:DNA invertase Pin-like site-specific DNA recombinase
MARTARTATETTQAVGYIRVSTEDQALSVDAQRERLVRWCGERGVELVAVFEDIGVSGGAALDKRPGLMQAMDALTPGSALLAVKRDRLARDTMNAAMIERLAERAGAKVLTCDGAGEGDSPEAKLMRTMIDAFAEYERAIIRARTKVALGHKQARGEKLGGDRPYGYQVAEDGKTLVADEAEQGLLDAITSARKDGLTQRAIVAKLGADGFTTRKGTPLSLMQVQRILAQARGA